MSKKVGSQITTGGIIEAGTSMFSKNEWDQNDEIIIWEIFNENLNNDTKTNSI